MAPTFFIFNCKLCSKKKIRNYQLHLKKYHFKEYDPIWHNAWISAKVENLDYLGKMDKEHSLYMQYFEAIKL